MELLDIVDENGCPTGQTAERTQVHLLGLPHRTSHVWIARLRGGVPQLLLQKRSDNKDSHPGCFDISSAGHIPAGDEWVESALRELREELGLIVRPEELHLCGTRRIRWQGSFYGKPFRDDQVSRVYLLWRDAEPEDLSLQESEISAVRWMNYADACRAVEENTIPHCIVPEELAMLADGLAAGPEAR